MARTAGILSHQTDKIKCYNRLSPGTSTDRLDALTEYIQKNHNYDAPEVVAVPIVGGSVGYLSWVTDETRPA